MTTLVSDPTRREQIANKVLGLGASDIYPAPNEGEFVVDGDELDYIEAPDIAVIAASLLADMPELRHLRTRDVRYLWKKQGGEKHGQKILGKCVKPSGLAKFYAQADWIICLSADNVLDCVLTRTQVEALLHHEMLHAGADEVGHAVVIGHDFEGFGLNVKRYGAWTEGLRICEKAWQQLPLFEAN